MATTKKATKKPATSKKAPAKPAVKTSVRRVSSAKSSRQSMKSLRPAKPHAPFFTFKPTQQTIYWLVLSALIIAFGLWVMDMNQRIQALYDRVDATYTSTYVHPAAHLSR